MEKAERKAAKKAARHQRCQAFVRMMGIILTIVVVIAAEPWIRVALNALLDAVHALRGVIWGLIG